MFLRNYKPVTPSLRTLVRVNRDSIYKGDPHKSLISGVKKRTGGRNNTGRITCRHIGGGAKKLYRIIDFKRSKVDCPAVVQRIEYDPNRTAFIALIKYEDNNFFSYIICPEGLKVGDKVVSSNDSADIKLGNCMPLRAIPIGTIVHNIEIKINKGAQIARSAGSYGQVVGKNLGYASIKLPSGDIRLVNLDCVASVGAISNPYHQNIKKGKAGANIWRGKRPTVRGVAMNPIDHPHGGGEGKTSGGRHPVTPWGKPTKGRKTRKSKLNSRFIIKAKKRVGR